MDPCKEREGERERDKEQEEKWERKQVGSKRRNTSNQLN